MLVQHISEGEGEGDERVREEFGPVKNKINEVKTFARETICVHCNWISGDLR